MKTVLASLFTVCALSSVASAGTHTPYKYRYERVVVFVKKPVYVQPVYVKKETYSTSRHGHGYKESAWGRAAQKHGI